MQIVKIMFFVLLADSLIANLITWFGGKDYFNKMKFFKRFLPLTTGWTIWYLTLVLFIGYVIYFVK